jgi:hypothetical protein
MATLEQGNGQFKYPSLASFEYELLPALWHRTGGTEPILIVGASSSPPLNDNPKPHSWDMSRTSTQSDPPLDNYRATESGLAAQASVVVPEGTWHIPCSQDSDESQQIKSLPEKSTLLTLQESNPERGPLSVLLG